MSTSTVTLSLRPCAKMVMHCAKHPSSTVRGLLIGTLDPHSGSWDVQDVVPLHHSWTELSPMTELAVAMAQAHLCLGSSSATSVILGCYEARSSSQQSEPSPEAVKMLASPAKDSLLLFVEPSELGKAEVGRLFSPYTSSASSLRPIDSNNVVYTRRKGLSGIYQLVAELGQEALVDFDDHLADTMADWPANAAVDGMIQSLEEDM